MRPIELLRSKKEHLPRFANQRGASGETAALGNKEDWLPRPKGLGMKVLLAVLRDAGKEIKKTSFDAIGFSTPRTIDFCDRAAVQEALPDMVFLEIKTTDKEDVDENFSGHYFSITENEIAASEALGDQYRVVLFHKSTELMRMISVSEILARAKSMSWQVSVQI